MSKPITAGKAIPKVSIQDSDNKEITENGELVEDNNNVQDFDPEQQVDPGPFKIFTKDTYARLCTEEEIRKRKEEEKKNSLQEGKLVGGELKFGDDDDEDGPKLDHDPDLEAGKNLPANYEVTKQFLGRPIEELDKYMQHKTFIVITQRFKKHLIHRYSATGAFFCLFPWNPIRKAAIAITTHQAFEYIILTTILVNCILLVFPESSIPWSVYTEYAFLGMYTLECILKVLARGFIVNKFTYLRDPWNWLDFSVVILGYVTTIYTAVNGGSIGNLSALRTFRVLRALKTVSIIPGLKTILSALARAMRMLIEVIILTLFCIAMFALFALQVYSGILRQKCVMDGPVDMTDIDYSEYIKNSTYWQLNNEGAYVICGNASGAGSCANNHTCLPDIGDNPNFGYTSFDDFKYAMLTSFQLITLDYWEDPYNKVIRANGPANILFFAVVVLIGSFYLINLMLAVVSMSYDEEAVSAGKEKEREKKNAKKDSPVMNYDPSKIKAKEKKDKSKDSKDETHLQVMSAVNGGSSQTTTSASVKGIGNGAIKEDPKITAAFKTGNDIDKAKTIDTKAGRNDNKNTSPKNTANNKNEAKLGVAGKKKDGYVNPLASMDSADSISIDSNDGDPPTADDKDDDDDELVDRNCACCSQCCKNYICWLKFQGVCYRIVSDLIFEMFITVVIVLNVIAMAMKYHGMSQEYSDGLDYANYIFTGIFMLELVLKLLALSKQYFYSGWNIFDMFIVGLSIIDLGISDIDGLSVFRAFRLMRVFKLAQTWVTMRMLLSIIMQTLSSLGNLTLVLLIFIYIFAVIGMQLFGHTYTPDKFEPGEVIRWNFNDFGHSLFLIFRVICGEWIEPLWDCMRASQEICMLVFIPTLILCNFMVLNLFLALLINSFASDKMEGNKGPQDSKFKQGWKKIKNLFKRKKKNKVDGEEKKQPSMVKLVLELKRKEASENEGTDKDVEKGIGDEKSPNGTLKNKDKKKDEDALSNVTIIDDDSDEDEDDKPKKRIKKKDDDEEEVIPGMIEDCWCKVCYKTCTCCIRCETTKCGRGWYKFRKTMHKITEHKVFEGFIIIVILISSGCLCFEDIYLYRRPLMQDILNYMDIFFIIVFTLEMFMKWVALGWKKYFTAFWTILDFCIVIISIVSFAANSTPAGEQIQSFRALRTFRALRPLRAVSRWQGMRIVFNALMYSIPGIVNVMLVCLVFWFIFSIAGVELFAGKFWSCRDADGEILDDTIVPNRTVCELPENVAKGYAWINADVHFDNVAMGLLALLQVATFEGWMEIMAHATDMTNVDQQPRFEASYYYLFYFIIFIIVGSFFTLNLLISVIIDNFNALKKKYEGGILDIFLTPSQKNYYNTMKKLGNRKPQKTIKRPKNKVQGFFFDVAMSNKFELAIVILILVNMGAMAFEHYKQSTAYSDALDILNIIFTTIFTLEAMVKIIGMRWHYFRRAWNVFDFVIVIISIIGVILNDVLRQIFITPTLLRVVRVFRIGRVLRLIKVAKGIRKLLFALVISLPALFNIMLLLLMVMFIFSIFMMNFFGHVRLTGRMDDVTNFQTFGNSMVLLFRLATAAGWNDILYPLMNTRDCDKNFFVMPDGEQKEVSGGDCGDPGAAIGLMVSFVVITYLIIINMYIAIILENFSQAHEQEEVGITEDDFEMFYIVWERYDPHASQFIKYEQLSDFVADLEQPLGMAKPNEIALVAFNLPIYNGDRLHCLDILISLVKHVLGGVEDTDEFKELKKQMEEKYRETFPTRVQQVVQSTTMRRKKEDVASKTLQRAWRKHKAQKNMRKITELAMEAKLQRSPSFSFGPNRRTSVISGGPVSPNIKSPGVTPLASRQGDRPGSGKRQSMGNVLTVPHTATASTSKV